MHLTLKGWLFETLDVVNPDGPPDTGGGGTTPI